MLDNCSSNKEVINALQEIINLTSKMAEMRKEEQSISQDQIAHLKDLVHMTMQLDKSMENYQAEKAVCAMKKIRSSSRNAVKNVNSPDGIGLLMKVKDDAYAYLQLLNEDNQTTADSAVDQLTGIVSDDKEHIDRIFFVNKALKQGWNDASNMKALSYCRKSNTVGIAYDDRDSNNPFVAYKTDERGNIYIRERFRDFVDALECANGMYDDMRSMMEEMTKIIDSEERKKDDTMPEMANILREQQVFSFPELWKNDAFVLEQLYKEYPSSDRIRSLLAHNLLYLSTETNSFEAKKARDRLQNLCRLHPEQTELRLVWLNALSYELQRQGTLLSSGSFDRFKELDEFYSKQKVMINRAGFAFDYSFPAIISAEEIQKLAEDIDSVYDSFNSDEELRKQLESIVDSLNNKDKKIDWKYKT